jgi:hypothetical protein
VALEATKQQHESSGVRTPRILAFVFGFLSFVAVLAAILSLFYHADVGRIAAPFQQFPTPRLQPHPRQDYLAFHKKQLEELAGTRWVNPQKTLVHVPIARAMAYIAARGAAAYDPLEETKTEVQKLQGVFPVSAPAVAPPGAHP